MADFETDVPESRNEFTELRFAICRQVVRQQQRDVDIGVWVQFGSPVSAYRNQCDAVDAMYSVLSPEMNEYGVDDRGSRMHQRDNGLSGKKPIADVVTRGGQRRTAVAGGARLEGVTQPDDCGVV